MRSFGQMFIAGAAGILALKILAGLVLPLLGMLFGFVMLMLKVAVFALAIWFVISLIKGRRNQAAGTSGA